MVQQLLEMPTLEDSSLVIFTSLALDRVDLLQEQGTQVFTKCINSMSAWGGCQRETRQKKLSNWSWAQHSKEKHTLSHEAAVKALSPKVKTQTAHPHNFGYLMYINSVTSKIIRSEPTFTLSNMHGKKHLPAHQSTALSKLSHPNAQKMFVGVREGEEEGSEVSNNSKKELLWSYLHIKNKSIY